MRVTWTRSLLLFSAAVVFATSCTKPEFSSDEPLKDVQEDNLYIISRANTLFAIDPVTGVQRWNFYDSRGLPYEPLALGEYVFVVVPNNVLKLSAITGKVVDSIFNPEATTSVYTMLGPITGRDNYVFVQYEVFNSSGTKRFFDQFDHTSTTVPRQPVNFSMQLTGTTNIPNTPVFLGNKMLIPFNAKTELVSLVPGAPIAWSNTGANPHNPVTDGQVMYVCAGSLLGAFDLNTGVQLWSYNAGDFISTSPIVFGRNVIFGCEDNKLYCIDPDAQAPRWIFETNERIYSSPYAYDQTVYFGGNDHYFYAINILDGSMKWRYRTGALIKSSTIAHDGMVYVGSYDLNLYGFDTSGALKWKRALNGLIDQSPVLYDVSANKGVYSAISGLSSQ
ncbi:MAG TPA: PQQ-binding-like beta-propeller repeat protein [Flavipsychrobacter sp.]